MPDIYSSNKISPLINSQTPEFVRIDHPTFVAFLETYYEWLELQGSSLLNPMALKNVSDVDSTFDDFITNFKNQYLLDFPETLAISQKTGNPVDVKTLLKNIKAFYRAKGTEKTYEFLFRILYDTNVEFYYPKKDLLKASDGKWIQKKTLRISSTNGTEIFKGINHKIYQKDATDTVIATAFVSEINKFQLSTFEITEVTITDINGTFSTLYPVVIETNSLDLTEPVVYSVISTISITSGGTNYRVGDVILFTNASNDSGISANAKVSQVSSSGVVQKIKIENFGANYKTAPTISIISQKGTGFSGTATIGAVCNFQGYYANNDGKPSSDKFIQDSHYYQNYSYVLKTEVVVDKYKETIKRLLHPAGMGFFGQILIKRCAQANLDLSSSLISYEVPLIGHYIGYTAATYDDLSQYFKLSGVTGGFYPDTQYLILESGNPITDGYPYIQSGTVVSTAGFPKADPFWVIYKHPNTRITGNVLAKIDAQTYTDTLFSNSDLWPEWTMTGNSERLDWVNSFTGDYKYAILKYDEKSEFGKITLRSFFTMPVGDEFDSRIEGGTLTSHGPSPNS